MKKLLNSLYIVTPDRYLSLDGENVVINADHTEIGRLPLHNIDSITVFGGAGASPALMGKCGEYGKQIVFLSRSGRFLSRCEGKTSGNVLLRREQYRTADDEKRSLEISRLMIAGKIYNSRYVLNRALRDHALRLDTEEFSRRAEYLTGSIDAAYNADSAEELRGIEGQAAQMYFSAFDDMILQQKEDFRFTVRSKRPPLDNVNALLSLTYSMATGMCISALESVGLDPYVGFLHTDRPGRASLALDMVEEFRAVLCDRFVLTLINKRMINADCFEKREDGAVLLTENGRKAFFKEWQERKQEELKHPFLGEKLQWGMVPYAQALLLSRFIRGDLDCYPVFLWRG